MERFLRENANFVGNDRDCGHLPVSRNGVAHSGQFKFYGGLTMTRYTGFASTGR
jgi:hypothetical protein